MALFMCQQYLEGKINIHFYSHFLMVLSRYSNTVPMFTPLPLSMMDHITTTLTGQATEFYDSKFISKGTGREGNYLKNSQAKWLIYTVTRVKSFGAIKITWNVLMKNESAFGYVFDSVKK